MANDKRFVVKNGLQTQDINFESPNKTKNSTVSMLDAGVLSFSGNTVFSDNAVFNSNTVFSDNAVFNSNVGIGITNPTEKLEVSGSIYINGTDGQGLYMNGGNGFFRANANSVAIHTNSAERIRIDSSGNVGIGATAPTQKLEVVGNIYLNGTDAQGILMNGGNAIVRASSGLSIRTGNNTEKIRIDAGGQVGIGINVPTAKLHVVGTARVTEELQAKVINSANGIMLNARTISGSYTIAATNNAMSAGPIEIASGITVTVATGARWVVL